MGCQQLVELLTATEEVYGELLDLCVWIKQEPDKGSIYRNQHELVCVFKSGNARGCNNIEIDKCGRNRSNVWQYAAIAEERKLRGIDPNVKPVALVADALLDCSNRGDLVLDPFLCSGTTLIAAERTGRCSHAIETDPVSVDTAIRRWQKLTGGKAIHASDGRSFEDHEEEVSNA
jgi:DNA modification methylase